MNNVPAFVSVVFMITTFVTVGIFLFGVHSIRTTSLWQKALLFLIPFGLIFQFVVASSGFYLDTIAVPPRLFLFGAAPSLLLILLIFVFARNSIVFPFSLTTLTITHVIRVPVELTLAWLADSGAVPQIMTFRGTNFDILSGVTAPIALYFVLRPSKNRALLADRLESDYPWPSRQYSYDRGPVRTFADSKACLRTAEHCSFVRAVHLAADGSRADSVFLALRLTVPTSY